MEWMLASTSMLGYEIPPSLRGSDDVVTEAGCVHLSCQMRVLRRVLICLVYGIVYDFISKLPLQAKASFNIRTKVHRGEIKKKRLDLY